MKADDGGPAFPAIETVAAEDRYLGAYSNVSSNGGMSLRDYFAARALGAILLGTDLAELSKRGDSYGYASLNAAVQAYAYADAMLAERAK